MKRQNYRAHENKIKYNVKYRAMTARTNLFKTKLKYDLLEFGLILEYFIIIINMLNAYF